MGLETVRRYLADVYWQSVPQPDCTWKEGLIVFACFVSLINCHIAITNKLVNYLDANLSKI